MRKLAGINILVGFLCVFFVALCGFFLRSEVVQLFLYEQEKTYPWSLTLMRTAHAHSNLFGVLQILFGLSISYSGSNFRSQIMQSIGFFCGTFAMSVLLFLESTFPVNPSLFSFNKILIGVFLSAWLIAVFWHCAGMFVRIWRF